MMKLFRSSGCERGVSSRESKPPVPFPHVLPPAVMPAQKPSPVNTKTMLPPPPAIPSRGPPAKQQIVKAGQPNIESIAATYLPEIPTQRPANSSNLTVRERGRGEG